MDDLISRLSELRSQYNCFNESEEPYYRALSEVIKMLSEQADGDTISRQALMKEFSDFVRASNNSDFARTPTWNDAVSLVGSMPSAQPEIKPIDYQDCANAMMKMWMDNVLTDGEYNRIMDKLNKYWLIRKENR